MDLLFAAEFEYNYNEFKKYMWRISGMPLMLLVCFYSLIVLFLGIVTKSFVYITLGILLPLLFFLFFARKIKKIYKASRANERKGRVYKFYDSCFSVEDSVNKSTVDYSNIKKIIFTKTNVYLMIAKNQGFILLRSTFPEGLEDFLLQIKHKQ